MTKEEFKDFLDNETDWCEDPYDSDIYSYYVDDDITSPEYVIEIYETVVLFKETDILGTFTYQTMKDKILEGDFYE